MHTALGTLNFGESIGSILKILFESDRHFGILLLSLKNLKLIHFILLN